MVDKNIYFDETEFPKVYSQEHKFYKDVMLKLKDHESLPLFH